MLCSYITGLSFEPSPDGFESCIADMEHEATEGHTQTDSYGVFSFVIMDKAIRKGF
jgi:hypothetical protein